MMAYYLLIFISTILMKNFALIPFFGSCLFLNISKNMKVALAMGLATTFVMTISSISIWFVNTWILVPFKLVYFRTLIFFLIVATIVQLTEIFLRKTSQFLHHLLGVFLSLITTNCIVLSIILVNINSMYNFFQSVFYGFSSGISLLVTILLFSSIHRRLSITDIPIPFHGNAITLITAGLMSLSFTGFNNLIKI